MNKKHLSRPYILLIAAAMTLLYGICSFSVAPLAASSLTESDFPLLWAVPFLPLFIPVICDIILRIKTDIPPFVTTASSFVAVILTFALYVLYPTPENSPYFGENYSFVLLSLISLAIRCVYGIADVIILKKYKLIFPSIIVALIGVASVFAGFNFEYEINHYIVNMGTGVADKTGSWGSINQDVQRGENWKQIVADSPFKLTEVLAETNSDGFEYNYCGKGTYPNIDGSTVCVPMAVEFARQHLGFEDKAANQFVDFSTTHRAYENLIHKENTRENYVYSGLDTFIDLGSVDLVIATEPSDEELQLAESCGVKLKKTPVCYDAFVFITHKNNPVESLSVEQIKKIYSGQITNWQQVGGNDEKIRAFQREKNSGSQTAMENLVMGGADMIDPIEVRVIEGMGMLVDAVAEYKNETSSLGYTYRYYIDTLYKNDNIKTLAVDGIAPSDENIRNGSYPFTTNYYGVIRQGEEDQTGGQFLNWILSDEGQQCVSQAGYITLK